MHAHTRQWHTKKSKHSEWTQWDEAKSGRPNLWAAPMIVQLEEATQYYYYRAVLAIFPLTPDQIRAQIWPNGVWGGMNLNSQLSQFKPDNVWSAHSKNWENKCTSVRQALYTDCDAFWWGCNSLRPEDVHLPACICPTAATPDEMEPVLIQKPLS